MNGISDKQARIRRDVMEMKADPDAWREKHSTRRVKK
jgi:hypothetical protein